jgi:hypothetical protein
MTNNVHSKLLRRPWSRRDAIRDKTRREKIRSLVEDFREKMRKDDAETFKLIRLLKPNED